MAMEETGRRKVLVEASVEQATTLTAELVKSIICESIGTKKSCNIALAGGTTPHGLYQRLAATVASGEVPWGQVCVFFSDERDVPHDDIESNYRMAQRTLLDHVPILPTQVYPIRSDREDLDSAAGEYEKIILEKVPAEAGSIPTFDLILLGMGGDGHIASVFPNTEAMEETKKMVMAYSVPVLGRKRITLTLPVINAANNVLLFVTGQDKSNAVANLLNDDPEARKNLPAARVAPKGNFFIVLDNAAARQAGLRAE